MPSPQKPEPEPMRTRSVLMGLSAPKKARTSSARCYLHPRKSPSFMTAPTSSTDSSPADEILFNVADGIATITLNRPQQRNALSRKANQRLFELWNAIDADASIAVVILTSADCGVFCAGMDLVKLRSCVRKPARTFWICCRTRCMNGCAR